MSNEFNLLQQLEALFQDTETSEFEKMTIRQIHKILTDNPHIVKQFALDCACRALDRIPEPHQDVVWGLCAALEWTPGKPKYDSDNDLFLYYDRITMMLNNKYNSTVECHIYYTVKYAIRTVFGAIENGCRVANESLLVAYFDAVKNNQIREQAEQAELDWQLNKLKELLKK